MVVFLAGFRVEKIDPERKVSHFLSFFFVPLFIFIPLNLIMGCRPRVNDDIEDETWNIS